MNGWTSLSLLTYYIQVVNKKVSVLLDHRISAIHLQKMAEKDGVDNNNLQLDQEGV